MEVRLSRVEDRRVGGTRDGACDVYPPGLVTVVRDRCSAGGVGDDGVGVGKLSGCGCAGSLRLFGSEGVVEALWVFAAGWSPVSVVPVCARYHSRMFYLLPLRCGGEAGAGWICPRERSVGGVSHWGGRRWPLWSCICCLRRWVAVG